MNKIVSELLTEKKKTSIGVQLTNDEASKVNGGYSHQEHARQMSHARMNNPRPW